MGMEPAGTSHADVREAEAKAPAPSGTLRFRTARRVVHPVLLSKTVSLDSIRSDKSGT